MWQASRPDTTPPTVVSHSPNTGATGVSQAALVTATFSEDMNPATIGTSTFELRGPGNTLVTATVTYNGGARTATLDPSSNLPGLNKLYGDRERWRHRSERCWGRCDGLGLRLDLHDGSGTLL